MTEDPPRSVVIATVKACEQYRFKVELPNHLAKATRTEMRRRALLEANSTYLECSKQYQEIGWVGIANVAFADTKTSPSDSKSEFLHSLMCLRLIELSALHFRESGSEEVLELVIEAPVTWATRKLFEKLCGDHGIRAKYAPLESTTPFSRPKIGGIYRPGRQDSGAFVNQPIKRFEDFRAGVLRRLTGRPFAKRCVNQLLVLFIMVLWPLPILARLLFGFVYQIMAAPVLRKLDGPKNVFVYFDLRLGRNRDVGSYLRWKYGNAFVRDTTSEGSVIPFSHLARPGQAYSFPAMVWAFKALRRMKSNPLEGCVVVNYLIPPWLLWKVQFRRNSQSRKKRRALRKLQQEATDFLSVHIYEEFISALDKNNAFPLEVSKCYKRFFDSMSPGTVVQADAAAKTARHFTACARQRGGRVIYVADRICTALRTSNQFISDSGSNPHLPNRCVVFDQVSKDEFLRQGMGAGRIYTYHRNFAMNREGVPQEKKSGSSQVVILLQAYEDNMEAMIRVGTDIASGLKETRVIYQEHPNFPVCVRMKAKLLESMPGRLRFLNPGEPVDYSETVALVTGYSTAAVPGILQGIPLIWLRRQIDNSIFGEAYLDRIGFAADKSEEVISFLKRLFRKDRAMLQACAIATAETRKIFIPVCSQPGTVFTDALNKALEDSFREIAAAQAREAVEQPGQFEPVNA